MLAGVEGVCGEETDEAGSRRVELRSVVVATLRDAASDDDACLRDVCELSLAGVALPGFFSLVLDVDEVLARLADVVVLLDVEVTLADVLPPPPLLGTVAGMSISRTLASVLDLDLTAALPPFTEADLDAESTMFACLLEDDDWAPFNGRPVPDLAASFVRLLDDGDFTFCPTDGISISCKVDGGRDLARLVVWDGGFDDDSATSIDLSSLFLFSAVALRCSDGSDADDVSSILPRAAVETTASAAAAAAA